jgi:outer membrane receptor protein involved in Fe transport
MISLEARTVVKHPLQLTAMAIAVAASLVAFQSVNAQEQPAASGQKPEEIVVTGSRIKQREDYVSPNPVSTFDSEKMEHLALNNVADVVTQVPQNVSQFQASTTGGGAFFVGSTLANLRGLNPFFGTRTLTLVDSRRFIPTTQGDSVDLNFIPSILIDRTEVVTGGASAAYGSGAVSGVVNILLDHDLEGVKLDFDMGQTGEGDGDNYHVGIAGGHSFANDRARFVVGAEYQQQDVIQSCVDARDWCRKGVGLFSNNSGFAFGAGQPYTPKIPGQPADIITSNLRQNQTSRTGVIFNNTAGATSTFQLNSAGTDIAPFAVGSFGWLGAAGTTIGGDGESIYKNLSLFPDIERKTVYGHAEYDFNDSLTGFFDLSWGNVVGVNHQWAPGQNTANNCIRPDNGFLPTLSVAAQNAIAARAFNSPFTCFGTVVTKDWSGQNSQTVTTDTEVTRFVVGLSGDLTETWSWDAYYQNGETTRDQIGDGYQTNWRYQMAIDSVIGPNGQPACRAVVTGQVPDPTVDPALIAGCQPLNPFGAATASQAALNYAFGDLTESNVINQDVIAGTVSGQLWKGWSAGPLMGAFGLEYRKEDLTNNAGNLPRAQRTDFSLQYGDSFAGKTNVKEAFMELEMPFLRDLPGARMLTVNVAGRRSEYENIGGLGTSGQTGTQAFTTWKAAFVYDPIEWLRFRGSRSQDLRAASFRELYYSQSIPPGGIFGYVQNPTLPTGVPTFFGDPAWQILSGNPQLNPEESLTETVGIVVSPGGGATGMHISADYYEITISGGQRLDGSPTVINGCFQRNDPVQCARIKFGPPLAGFGPLSNIDEVNVPYINASPYTAKGIDYSFDYPLQLDNGTVTFNLTATRAIDLLFQDTISLQIRDVAGQSGGGFGFLPDVAPAPEWIGNLIVSYIRDRFTITGQARYTGSGKLDLLTPRTGPSDPEYNPNLTGSVSNNEVPSHTTFNLSGSYDLKLGSLKRAQLFGSITNLFDKDPPFSGNNGFGVGGVNAAFFDTLGRDYRIGMRMQF